MSTPRGSFPPELLDAAVELMARTGRGATVRVQGRSMVPTLQEGQILSVDFAPGELRRGDLLLFRQRELLVVHRLLGPAKPVDGAPRLRTRGDGVSYLDPPVNPARVVGRVISVQGEHGWRSVRSAGARRYAWCLAWHDLAWAAAGTVARWADRPFRRMGRRRPFHALVSRVDRALVGAVHRVFFERLHPEDGRPEPAQAEPLDP